MRVDGYTYQQIADLEDMPISLVVNDITWCKDHLPEAYNNAADLRRLSLERADALIQSLIPRARGGNTRAAEVIISIMDYQAKLIGAYAPKQIDNTMQVSYDLNAPEGKDV